MGDDDDYAGPKTRPPLWQPQIPRLPLGSCGKSGSNPSPEKTNNPYPCPRKFYDIRKPDDLLGREESGASKKSSARSALLLGDTLFKRFDVPLHQTTQPEKDDESDIWLLKQMHFNMSYADTYIELSASKVFAVEYFDRGISLTCILIYCICAGFLVQKVEEIRNKFVISFSNGYMWPANFLWWNSVQFTNYMLIAHCFGILQILIFPVIRRLYYIMFSLSFVALLCAYLQKHGCWALCPGLMWAGFIITLMSAGRPNISNRMGDPLADVLFFGVFLMLMIQAICAKDEDMQKCLLLLLLGFAYAGPMGNWGWFNFRIVIWTICLYYAIPILEDTFSPKGGPHTPKTMIAYVKEDWRKMIPHIMALPISTGCPLKQCEPGLFDLFAGQGFGFMEDDEDEKKKGWKTLFSLEAWDIELPPSFDDFLFWLFVILMVIFDLYCLFVMEDKVELPDLRSSKPCIPYELTEKKDFKIRC
ncbi:unnamed protein product [Notodromas monacha]|uniref:Uncharacterized protein n=1 Tax=Notodromas monacha TaxID=399045 RepID=A0A7R9GEJ3_9CRUS|nr:unnamed protein product [Notodromas monacha]CAG0918337.1 unnamed protein product [Notodromas monacha]